MNYSAINIQGNIISSDILEKIRTEDIRSQKASDFELASNASVRDEINMAWSVAVSNWNVFKSKREALKDSESGTSETRKYWIVPLLQVLGYETILTNAEIINGKSYAISHRASNKDKFPIHIVGVNQSLDKRAEQGGTRLSPHALVQEYLNNNEHMYSLLTNGRFIRLLRDATRLSRLSYLEFDIEKIMEEGLYVEFALFYRTLHASRMPKQQDSGAESILEFYHQESLSSGSRIRERLSEAVENSIKELANGFLQHPYNEELRISIKNEEINSKTFYLEIMRLVYRILFLLVIEERKLIFKESKDEKTAKNRSVYYNFYSIQRITKLATRSIYIDPRKTDLWQSVLATFSIFEYEKHGSKLGIKALGSGLFSPGKIGILDKQLINNKDFLKVVSNLVTFSNENGHRVRVNYADLDVEEFGSVYEGLLDLEPQINLQFAYPEFRFIQGGKDRSSSGSHYTPEELVKPLITHSLDYLIEDKLKEKDPEKGLLSLKICDVACGSGHILLSAARRVGFELAKYRSQEDQPTPSVLRIAVRDVICNCIYGVDFNPMAVELCKVALWLEAHEPGEPLNFLDHHVKWGNAIVGLAHKSELENGIASEAFKTLPTDDSIVAKTFRDKNNKERKERTDNALQLKADFEKSTINASQEALSEFAEFNSMPENTADEIAKKEIAYQKFIDSKGFTFLKAMADTQVAQFFIPKTEANKDYLMTDADYRLILSGYKGWQDRKVAKAKAVAFEQGIFHWFIEFPEVFNEGGFDCVLGNPPYLGDKKQKQAFGESFLEYIRSSYSVGINDLVVYFFNRIYQLIDVNRYQALITTSSISQGDMRAGALDNIQKLNGNIIYAIKSLKWPGVANLNIALIVIKKGPINKESVELNGRKEKYISSFLTPEIQIGEPYKLKGNEDLMFTGIYFLGDGFLLSNEKADEIIATDQKYKDVVFPFINGDDINDSVTQKNSRSIINFFDWSLDKVYDDSLKTPKGKPFVIDYPLCHEIIVSNVKTERQRWKLDVNGNEIIGEYSLDKAYREKWWQFARSRPELRKATKDLNFIFATAQTTKYLNFIKLDTALAVSQTAFVFASDRFNQYVLLQSIVHFEWALKYGNSKGDTFRYAPASTFETFPFPQNLTTNQKLQLETIGENYHEHRKQLMLGMQLGLTKTYNLFHSNAILSQSIDDKDKQVVSLQKHLEKIANPDKFGAANTISIDEALQGILKLRELHVQMDEEVLNAYGWGFDSAQPDKGIDLRHDFYEVDYLPENDRVRFTIHPDARKEVLKRLLELNHKIHEEEVTAGLFDKKPSAKSKKQKETNPDQNELF